MNQQSQGRLTISVAGFWERGGRLQPDTQALQDAVGPVVTVPVWGLPVELKGPRRWPWELIRSPWLSLSKSACTVFRGLALFSQRGEEGFGSWGVSSKYPPWAADSARFAGTGQGWTVLVSVELAWTLSPRIKNVPKGASVWVLAWFTVLTPPRSFYGDFTFCRVISGGRRWDSVWFRSKPRSIRLYRTGDRPDTKLLAWSFVTADFISSRSNWKFLNM